MISSPDLTLKSALLNSCILITHSLHRDKLFSHDKHLIELFVCLYKSLFIQIYTLNLRKNTKQFKF